MRSALAALLILAATPVAALDTTIQRGDRIGVLTRHDSGDTVRRYLAAELRKLGYDAFTTDETLESLTEETGSDADFYVELAGGTDNYSWGGIGVGGEGAGVGIDIGTTYASAIVRLYDGPSLELIDTFDVRKKTTALAPSAVGVGGRHVGVWIALPFIQILRERSAIRAVARDAAAQIAGAQAH